MAATPPAACDDDGRARPEHIAIEHQRSAGYGIDKVCRAVILVDAVAPIARREHPAIGHAVRDNPGEAIVQPSGMVVQPPVHLLYADEMSQTFTKVRHRQP